MPRSKLSAPSRLVRRVLSRNSTSLKSPRAAIVDAASPEMEMGCLKEQVTLLQHTISSMQEECEKHLRDATHVTREKQQLCAELRKQQRLMVSLKQQLKDEREYYFHEKQQYCQEMSEYKNLRKKLGEVTEEKGKGKNCDEAEMVKCKDNVDALKATLNKAFVANYNLSKKFLRMRNTKNNLKTRLKEQERSHKQAIENMKVIVDSIKNDLFQIMDSKFSFPISASNKKYLQIIKRNGSLMYENMCLQIEVERLSDELRRLKFSQAAKEEKLKQQLEDELVPELQQNKIGKRHVRAQEVDRKQSDTTVVKIFERKKVEGTPKIVMLPSCQENIQTNRSSTTQGFSKQLRESNSATQSSSKSSSSFFRSRSLPNLNQTSVHSVSKTKE